MHFWTNNIVSSERVVEKGLICGINHYQEYMHVNEKAEFASRMIFYNSH